jgi:hypothetical protein
LYGGSAEDRAYAITIAPNNDIYFCGQTISTINGVNPVGGFDIFVYKISSTGSVTWVKTIGKESIFS